MNCQKCGCELDEMANHCPDCLDAPRSAKTPRKESPVRVGLSPITKRIYAGRVRKDGVTWKHGHQHDVTTDVIKAILDLVPPGTHQVINANGVPSFVIRVESLPKGAT